MPTNLLVGEREVAELASLNRLIQKARGKASRLTPSEVLELASNYRAGVARLALIRREGKSIEAVQLERLLLGARGILFRRTEKVGGSVLGFVTTGYWQRIGQRKRLFAFTILFFVVCVLAGGFWGDHNPQQAIKYLPAQFDRFLQPRGAGEGFAFPSNLRIAFSTQIFVNNIRVAALAALGGATLGILTVYLFFFNSMMVGIISGISIRNGQGAAVIGLLFPHGVLELTCIAVASYAGFRVASSILFPGGNTRRGSLQAEMLDVSLILVGTALWLVVAGMVEGFVSPTNISTAWHYIAGVIVGLPFWILLIVRGGFVPSRRDTQIRLHAPTTIAATQ